MSSKTYTCHDKAMKLSLIGKVVVLFAASGIKITELLLDLTHPRLKAVN